MHFYEKVIRARLADELDSSVLVVCGSHDDARILRDIGFRNVTITNLDDRANGVEPYRWAHEDAERLSYSDNSFDWVLVNAGLHHCASPHQALCEMYRVCRKGVLALEARDSLLMRCAVRLGVVPQYELIAVAVEGFETGGLRNTSVPNFIYRWTEREVRKTLETAAPHHVHDITFFHHLDVPNYRMVILSPGKRAMTWVMAQGARLIGTLAPSQGNHFGWLARKTGRLKPWMDGAHLRRDYALGFDPKKYRGYH